MEKGMNLTSWASGDFIPLYMRLLYMDIDKAMTSLGPDAPDKQILDAAYAEYTQSLPAGDLTQKRWKAHSESCLADLRTVAVRPWEEKAAAETEEPETKPGRKSVRPVLISAEALDQKHLRPIEWIVDGILPVGLSVVGAPPKSYKSYMMLDLCAAVAEGKPWLGRKTSKHAALYLDLESTQRRPQARLRQILGDGAKPADLYISTSDSGWARVGEGFEEQLTEVIQENPDIKLVVIDVLSYVRPAGNARAKEYDRDYAAMMPLKKLADRLDIAIICVTHTTKMSHPEDAFNAITGSQAVTGACDSQMVICKRRGEADGRLVVTGRDAEYMDMHVRFDQDSMRWQYLGTEEERQYQQQQRDYETSDVVTAILTVMSGKDRWEGTVEALIDASDSLWGYDSRQVGRQITKWQSLLETRDKISHEMIVVRTGNTTQRQHIFCRIEH